MVRVMAPWGVAFEVRTKNLLLKEADSEHFKVRNLADSVYKSVYLAYLKPFSSIVFQSDANIDTRGNVAGYVGLRSYDGSNYQTILNLKGGIGEIGRIKMVGVNSDLWRSMGPYVFVDHFLPSGMLEYTSSGSPTITWKDDYLRFQKIGSGAANAQFVRRFATPSGGTSWDKDRYFGARVRYNPDASMGMWIATGYISATNSRTNTAAHFGFVFDGTELYVSCANGTSQTIVDATSVTSGYYRLEAILNAAGDTISYYKDGSLLQTLTTNVPNGTGDAERAFHWNIWDTTGVSVTQDLYLVRVYQEP